MNEIARYLSNGFIFVPAVVGYPIKNGKVLLGERREVSNNFGLGKIKCRYTSTVFEHSMRIFSSFHPLCIVTQSISCYNALTKRF